MQKLKEKYPVYKDYTDENLLQAVVKAHPVYAPIAEREFGSIKERKPGAGEKILGYMTKGLLTKEEKKAYSTVRGPQVIPQVGIAAVKWATRQIDRPVAAVRKLASGSTDMLGGFLHPERTEGFGQSAVRAWGIKDKEQAKWVAGATDVALGLGVLHLTFNTLPRAIVGAVNATKSLYAGKQGKALLDLENILTTELVDAGLPEISARNISKAQIWKQFSTKGALQKTPGKIQKTINILKDNKGKLANAIKQNAETAKATAARDPAGASTIMDKMVLGTESAVKQPIIPTTAVQLKYKNVPKTVAKTLPNEVISSKVTPMVQKVISKFPEKVTDQKSLEKVGNAIAKDMGIVAKIEWKYKGVPKGRRGMSGVHSVKEYSELKPGKALTAEELLYPRVDTHSVIIRVGKPGIVKVSPKSPLGKRHPELAGKPISVSQGRIKKLIVHELSHITAPPEKPEFDYATRGAKDSKTGEIKLVKPSRKIHHTIFDDEVDYYKESALIKREMRKAQAAPVSSKVEDTKQAYLVGDRVELLGPAHNFTPYKGGPKDPNQVLVKYPSGKRVLTFIDMLKDKSGVPLYKRKTRKDIAWDEYYKDRKSVV